MLSKVAVSSQTAAIAYIQNLLRDGSPLAKAALGLPFANGHLFTYLPSEQAETTLARLTTAEGWRNGGVLAQEDAWAAAAAIVDDYLSATPRHTAVLEDMVGHGGDPAMRQAPAPYFEVNEYVYYELTAKSPARNGAGGALHSSSLHILNWARSFRLVVWLLSESVLSVPPNGRLITGDRYQAYDVTDLSQRMLDLTQGLIVSAFDAEGFLVWFRAHQLE